MITFTCNLFTFDGSFLGGRRFGMFGLLKTVKRLNEGWYKSISISNVKVLWKSHRTNIEIINSGENKEVKDGK